MEGHSKKKWIEVCVTERGDSREGRRTEGTGKIEKRMR